MSVDASAFFTGPTADQIRAELDAFVGHSLRPGREDETGPGVWTSSLAGIHVDMVEHHDLVDDRGIAFTSYPCQARFVGYADEADLKQDLCTVLALLFARRASKALGCRYLVVEGVQRLVEEG